MQARGFAKARGKSSKVAVLCSSTPLRNPLQQQSLASMLWQILALALPLVVPISSSSQYRLPATGVAASRAGFRRAPLTRDTASDPRVTSSSLCHARARDCTWHVILFTAYVIKLPTVPTTASATRLAVRKSRHHWGCVTRLRSAPSPICANNHGAPTMSSSLQTIDTKIQKSQA